jgi:ribosomal protein S18 acetylase RimI-like enzyme
MDGLTIRKASVDDMPLIAELIAGDPGKEALGILGNAKTARRFGLGMYGVPPGSRAWKNCAVAEAGKEVIGVIQTGSEETVRITPGLAFLALRTLGPLGVVRALSRMKARDRVHIRPPAGTCHITEIDVDPQYRGRGIGGMLLDHAEAEAGDAGYKQMSLSTTMDNPARRLYERHGFRVVETKTDPAYERFTGIEGRVLMVKDLE